MESLRSRAFARNTAAPGAMLMWLGLVAVVLVLGLALASCQAETNGKEGTAPTTTTTGGSTGGGSTGGGSGGTTSSLSFATDVLPLFTSQGCNDCHGPSAPADACTGCHSDGRSPSSAYMSDLEYEDLISIAPPTGVSGTYLVDPSNSDGSVLYWVVSQDSRFTYDGSTSVMLSKMDLFTNTQISTVKTWIDEGANP